MYDRKTWIVVGICAVLLALNFHYGSKRAAEERAASAAARQQEPAATPAEGTPTEGPEAPGVLEEVDPDPSEVIEPTGRVPTHLCMSVRAFYTRTCARTHTHTHTQTKMAAWVDCSVQDLFI